MLNVPLRKMSVAALVISAVAPIAQAERILVIPDTSRDKVWSFSTYDGSVLSNNFIPADGIMTQVMQIAQTPLGTLIMTDPGSGLSCSTADAVREYSPCGVYIRTLAGPDQGVCNPNGVCIAYGKVWFTRSYDAASEPTAGRNALWSMNYDGTGLTEQCGSTSFGRIWGLLPNNGGFIVSDSIDDNLEFAPANCANSTPFYAYSQGGGTMRFPQQSVRLPDGSVVGNFFSGSPGLAFFSPTGEFLGQALTPASRGVYPLGNGEIMACGGTSVRAYNPITSQWRIIVDQISPIASFRWISEISICREDLDCSGAVDGGDLGAMLGNWGLSGTGDLNGDGVVNGADLGLLLARWGACSYQ